MVQFLSSICCRRMFLCAAAGLFYCLSNVAQSAPFDEQIEFRQPDGAKINLHGWGDEFSAVFETQDGFTVVFDPAKQAYCFAQPAADGTLASTGVLAHRGNPASLGLAKHARMSKEARKRQVVERWQRWEEGMETQKRWTELKAQAHRLYDQTATGTADGGPELAPPGFTTIGNKTGLTLLVDFSDDPATIPQAEIVNYLNGDGYTGYGNNGSVKSYFSDNSGGMLTYTNVVTIYIRVPQPKTYYNDTTKDCGAQGRLLINDALATLKALPNYNAEILPLFDALTVDANSRVVACNVFYAGGNGGVWSYGLWPHSWSLASAVSLNNGKSVFKYQITNLGNSLVLGTFCHENGHMLCGYPDIYDYNYDSTGGAGVFCLMNSGGSGTNPRQICAYLKRASGWATTVELNTNSSLFASVSASGANFNRFYRFQKPGVNTEYFLIENRQPAGRDALLPGGGVLIWHIDELGNRDNQSTNYNTTHANYEVSLMQADNRWHFQGDVNSGDANDPYYAGNTAPGYANAFSDVTSPGARWWDGTDSGAIFRDFSANGTVMTFAVGAGAPPLELVSTILADSNGNGVVDYNETNQFWIVLRNAGTLSASNVTATLAASAANVAVQQNVSAYPDAAPGQLVTNITPFVFATGPAFACGTQIQFTSIASCTGRDTTNQTTLPSGTPTAVFVRFDNNTPVAIPDKPKAGNAVGQVLSTNVVSGFAGVLGNITVSLFLTHANDGDLLIDLISPDGTTNVLSNARGDGGTNFGSAASPDSSRTTFADAATTGIVDGTAAPPFVGSYRPEQSFSVHLGKSGSAVNGQWKLRVRDLTKNNTGTLQAWSLHLAPAATCVDGSLQPLIVTLDSPTNNQIFASTDSIPLTATAVDPAGTLDRVEFYDDTTLLASVVTAPYSFGWTNPPAGMHVIKARAVSLSGLTASASAVIGVYDGSAPMTWTGGAANNNWSDPFNWNRFRAPTNSEPLLFSGDTRLVNTNDTLTAVGGIILTNGPFVLNGNALTLNGGITSFGTNTWRIHSRLGAPQSIVSSNGLLSVLGNVTNSGYALTLSGAGGTVVNGGISGTGGLSKTGSGTLTLNAANTYTGGTVVNAGTAKLAYNSSGTGTLQGTLTVNSNATVVCAVNNALGWSGANWVRTIFLNFGTLRTDVAGDNGWGTTIVMTAGTLSSGVTGGYFSMGSSPVVNVLATNIPSVISANLTVRDNSPGGISFNVNRGTAPSDLDITGALLSVGTGGITKTGPGILRLSGSNTYAGTTAVNAGTLLVNGSTASGAVTVASAATLGGSGLIAGPVTVSAGGSIAPGNAAIGSLTVSNTVTLAGFTRIEISRTGAALTNDLLRGATSLSLGGSLVVTNLNEPLVEGDAFPIFSAGTYAGNFVSSNLPALAAGLAWNVSTLKTDGTIRVAALPAITAQPQSLSVTSGNPASFTVVATGTPALGYQWRKNGSPLPGATASTFNIPAAATNDAAGYTVVVTNAVGSVTSSVAALAVVVPPWFTTQPQSAAVNQGATASFIAAASGIPAPAFQWYFNGTPLPEATSPALSIPDVQGTNAGSYLLVASSTAGSATSSVVALTVIFPPAITAQPQSLLVSNGADAAFSVTAHGTGPLNYQWFKGLAPVLGATSATFSINPATTNDAGNYSVVITNAAGAVTSSIAALTIQLAPEILIQPASALVAAGGNAVFSLSASGFPAPTIQWFFGTNELAGETFATLTITNAQATNAGEYHAVAVNAAGAAASAVATLTVVLPPVITNQPASLVVTNGDPASFICGAEGFALVCQWRKNGTPVPAATNALFTLASAGTNDAANYDVVVWNIAGSATSVVAALSVLVPPSIVQPPANQSVLVGSPASFDVVATGTAPLAYQWFKDSSPLSGATNASLAIAGAQTNDAGIYTVSVANAAGSITSPGATLDVNRMPSVPPVLLLSRNGGLLTLTWPTNYPGIRLQSQTNLLGSGLGTNWSDVSGATGGYWIVPVDLYQNSVFYRLLVP